MARGMIGLEHSVRWREVVIAGVLGATALALVERVRISARLHRLLAENSSDLRVDGARPRATQPPARWNGA